jgi:hypothetical protein
VLISWRCVRRLDRKANVSVWVVVVTISQAQIVRVVGPRKRDLLLELGHCQKIGRDRRARRRRPSGPSLQKLNPSARTVLQRQS